ncbi:MAG: MATE family efflux transporter, partial [Methanobacterium sp.]|nr:MATE family efflux transporter [Methanobacterium sp.]
NKQNNKSEYLLTLMKDGHTMSLGQQIQLVLRLSAPAIMAQVTAILMQYIDASMVGRLGSGGAASIGLVSSSTWLFGGLCSAAAAGFSVQVAQLVGAKKDEEARSVLKQAFLLVLILSAILVTVGLLISPFLPVWLRANPEIQENAKRYFQIFILSIPAYQLNCLAAGMIQCSGNMRVPSLLNGMMCVLDVIFNALLIFPTRNINVLGGEILFPGANLGVSGAALGTALAEVCACAGMMLFLLGKKSILSFRKSGSWNIEKVTVQKAVKIALPIGCERVLMCGAMIVTTYVVAPLGTIAIAANSFAITAESLCYMPGYGIGDAATTLVGQSLGAKRIDYLHKFANISVLLGIGMMTITGTCMFFLAGQMMGILTPDPEIQNLGIKILRIEAFAEPLYGASIVVSGALRGAGDTLIPTIMNFSSIWFVRLPLAVMLSKTYGLVGVWIAMCLELCVRGILFLVRLYREKWLKK